MVVQTKSPKGITAVGIFLMFGAIMACLAGTTLVWRGSFLDRIWAISAPAYSRLAPLGKTVGIPFLVLGATLLIAGRGWFKRRSLGVAVDGGHHRNAGSGKLIECLDG